MDRYRQLAENLRKICGQHDTAVCQGIVTAVDGMTCSVKIGNSVIPGIRLKASEVSDDGSILLVPAVGSAVTLASLSGDFTDMVVVQVDKVDSVQISGTVVLNGGGNGGLINIAELTEKLNALVNIFNLHIHTDSQSGPTGVPNLKARKFNSADFEDVNIKH